MLKIENVDVTGWIAAIRGARNPMNSWNQSDTSYGTGETSVEIGARDLKLLRSLANAGTDHGKFLRMITVTVDLTAPLYWYKEFDTYKVGTVANSCSTMHKIHAKKFTLDDFSYEHLDLWCVDLLERIIYVLNDYRSRFLESKDKDDWWNMIQLLPSSYNQRRTVLLNYAILRAMYHARRFHKLDEWREFCRWCESLPYSELITGEEVNDHADA
jgi:hypothetical protein